MEQWLKNNFGSVFSVVLVIVAAVGTWVKYGSRISQLEKDRDAIRALYDELKGEVHGHQSNTALHIDPVRDKEARDELVGEMRRGFAGVTQRFDASDRKIERILENKVPIAT